MSKAVQSQSPRVTRFKLYAGAGGALLVLLLALRSAAIIALVTVAALTVAFFVLRARWRWHRTGGKTAMRRRRKFQGHATGRELRRNLPCAGVLLGDARRHGPLYGGYEDFFAVFGPQRSGKSAWLAGALADAPGAALSTSTRVDMWVNTSVQRARLGPVLVLNPALDGGIPSTFAWNPLEGCETAAGAIARAGYLMDAAPRDTSGRDAWWDAQGAILLRLMMHAGALVGASMMDVGRWVRDPLSAEPGAILAAHPLAAPGWEDELAAITGHAADEEYMRNVARGAVTALSWLSDPAMAATACPRDSWEGFSARQFIAEGGTVYLIGTDRPHNSLAPYFAVLTAHLFDTAKQIAAESPGCRCDPPLSLVIDEPAVTCPVPLDRWSAEAGGHGVTVVTGFQSRSQLAARWGPDGARTIWNNATVKLIYGGFTDHEDLEAFSGVCGDRDTWHHVRHPDGSKTRQPDRERLYPPERIRLLPPWHALVLHRNTRPVEVTVTPVWDRPGYEPAEPARALPAERPAIEAPHREPIALPYSPQEEIPCSSATTSA